MADLGEKLTNRQTNQLMPNADIPSDQELEKLEPRRLGRET